jgi:hypothetical protein
MRISFDIDDTLVCHHPEAACETSKFPLSLTTWAREPLRLGAKELIKELQRRGHDVWIYTSSLRPPLYIRLWLLAHGIRVQGVINQDIHDRTLKRQQRKITPSKFPPAFGIDLHVDDSEGVRMEGEMHGFRVLVITPQEPCWVEQVLRVVAE